MIRNFSDDDGDDGVHRNHWGTRSPRFYWKNLPICKSNVYVIVGLLTNYLEVRWGEIKWNCRLYVCTCWKEKDVVELVALFFGVDHDCYCCDWLVVILVLTLIPYSLSGMNAYIRTVRLGLICSAESISHQARSHHIPFNLGKCFQFHWGFRLFVVMEDLFVVQV